MSESAIRQALYVGVEKLGYATVRPQQELAVLKFAAGQDVFVSLPTGSGKSLCYCVLPAVFDSLRGVKGLSIIVVVSPLIALMKDQVRAMMDRGTTAVYVGDCEDEQTVATVCSGQHQIVYMSPEALLRDERWRDMLLSDVYSERLVALVVDEAHCVKKWGETFRKEYMMIGEARSLVPKNVHIMALTATATKSTRLQVCHSLGMVRPFIVSQSPNRCNIKYTLHTATNLEETFAPMVEEIRRKRVTMEKVCRTYDACSRISLFLKSRLGGESVDPINAPDLACFRLVDLFTACTHKTVEDTILHSFSDPNSIMRVVVATVAFGMGLDCPKVRRIIHWGASSDIESYLQETGRAGRDGLHAEAILYVVGHPSNRFLDEGMKDYCKNKDRCRRQLLLHDFDGDIDFDSNCSCCDICTLKCTCSVCS